VARHEVVLHGSAFGVDFSIVHPTTSLAHSARGSGLRSRSSPSSRANRAGRWKNRDLNNRGAWRTGCHWRPEWWPTRRSPLAARFHVMAYRSRSPPAWARRGPRMICPVGRQ